MHVFHLETIVASGLPELFQRFSRCTSLITLAPESTHLTLIDGPDEFQKGDRLVWQIKRWGLGQRMTVDVIDYIADQTIVMEQVQGPLKQWRHTQKFEASGTGTKLCDMVEYEPPGGILGLTVTAASIEKDLQESFAFRNSRLLLHFPNRESNDEE